MLRKLRMFFMRPFVILSYKTIYLIGWRWVLATIVVYLGLATVSAMIYPLVITEFILLSIKYKSVLKALDSIEEDNIEMINKHVCKED